MHVSIIYIEEESYATEIGKVIKDTVKKYNWIRSMRTWTSTFCHISKQATVLDARASRGKWPAQFMLHWYGKLFTE